MAQPLGLVGEQTERGRMRFRETEAGESDELVVDEVRSRGTDALADRALDEAHPVRLQGSPAALAAHRPAQAFRFSDGEPGERDRHVEHLVLEDDDAERGGKRGTQ